MPGKARFSYTYLNGTYVLFENLVCWRLARVKVIRDPVHDIIRLEEPFVLALVNSTAMQRLRRIRQLGLAWLVYPGAEHSRFTHSLGVYHLAERFLRQLEGAAKAEGGRRALFDKGQRDALLAAALLHDVGHGPFSHVFENVSKQFATGMSVGHESWSRRFLREDEEISKILAGVSKELPQQVDEIINGTFKPHYVTASVSSQLDVDRFDYLLRDSHMTGCRYGTFDLEWMLRTLTVRTVRRSGQRQAIRTVVVDAQRGVSGLEMYVLGRHYMYQHVYYHKTIRSAEKLLGTILRRAAELIREGDAGIGTSPFRQLALGEPIGVPDYRQLNDFLILSWIDEWARSHDDDILRDLSERFTHRQLFKPVRVPREGRAYAEAQRRLQALVEDNGKPVNYYLLQDDTKDVAYKGVLYNLGERREPEESEIWCVRGDDAPRLLSQESNLLRDNDALTYQEERWFVPAELGDAARGIVASLARGSGRGNG